MLTQHNIVPKDTATELARAVLAADAHLKSSSDHSVHLWALVCLLRAAEASGAHLARVRQRANSGSGDSGDGPRLREGMGKGAAAVSLSAAWRSAWDTLLRADMQFSNPTARCKRGSVGEAVVAVLRACMRERLLDSAFVTKKQVTH